MLYPDDPDKIREALQHSMRRWGKILPEYAKYIGGVGREVYVTFSPARGGNVFARFWTVWRGEAEVYELAPEIVFEDILDEWHRPPDEHSYSWEDTLKAATAVVIYEGDRKRREE